METELAERLLAGESLDVDDMLPAFEEMTELCQRLRRVEEQYIELKAAAWNVEKAFLHNQGSMDRAIDTLSDLLQEGK